MKKLMVCCGLVYSLINCLSANSASLIITGSDAHLGYTSIYKPFYSTPDEWLTSEFNDPSSGMKIKNEVNYSFEFNETFRSFCDFNLQTWYNIGAPVSSITRIIFRTPVIIWDEGTSINFYARTSSVSSAENGTVDFSDDHESDVTAILTEIQYESNRTELVVEITDAAQLNLFKSDISASKSYTGVSMRVYNESNVITSNSDIPADVYKEVLLDTYNPQRTSLEIQFNFNQVPEPVSLILLLLAGITTGIWKMRKNELNNRL